MYLNLFKNVERPLKLLKLLFNNNKHSKRKLYTAPSEKRIFKNLIPRLDAILKKFYTQRAKINKIVQTFKHEILQSAHTLNEFLKSFVCLGGVDVYMNSVLAYGGDICHIEVRREEYSVSIKHMCQFVSLVPGNQVDGLENVKSLCFITF